MNDFFNSDALDSIPQIPHTPAEPITFDFDIIENLDTGSIHNIPTDLLKSESTDMYEHSTIYLFILFFSVC